MTSIDYSKKASKISIGLRRSVCDVGINDANYIIRQMIDGKYEICPFYQKWTSMLKRCYSEKLQKRQPYYAGCTVSIEWLIFSNFKSWMEKQDWQSKHLDKDILVPHNKVYSHETCLFVTQEINNLLTDSSAARGNLPQGVSFHKRDQIFESQIRRYGKLSFIGRYDTQKEASLAYRKAKSEHIKQIAETQPEPIRSGLLRHAELFNNNEEIEK